MSNENDSMPKDKVDLLQRIEREWSALMQAIERLDDEQMSVPGPGGWSVKDNLAHLAAWEQFMLGHHIQGRPAHKAVQLDQATMERLDEDGLNAILHERNRDRSVADVLAGLRRSHQQVLDTLQQMTYGDLMRQRFPDDPEARPVMAWVIGNTYDHYQEHRRIIEALIGESPRFRS
jgi:hypothetical protein